jgi:hypothetical protein
MHAHLGEYETCETELKQVAHTMRYHSRPGHLAAVNKFGG